MHTFIKNYTHCVFMKIIFISLIVFVLMLIVSPVAFSVNLSTNNTELSENTIIEQNNVLNSIVDEQSLKNTELNIKTEILDWNYKFANMFLISFSIVILIIATAFTIWFTLFQKKNFNETYKKLEDKLDEKIKIAIPKALKDSETFEETEDLEIKSQTKVRRLPFEED